MYLFKVPAKSIIITFGIYSEAVTAWNCYIRQMLADFFNPESRQIGGPGFIIEVDGTNLEMEVQS